MLELTLHASSRFRALQVEALTEEFYQQGDREKMLGMQPLPFMNREKGQDIASAQVRFMRVEPCALLVQTLPELSVMLVKLPCGCRMQNWIVFADF